MKIESYEPYYHIGIKLHPSVNLINFREKILQNMTPSGFTNVADVKIPSGIKYEIEVLATDEPTKIELNYKLGALNAVGKEPKATTAYFKKLIDFLISLGYELKGLSTSFDVATNVCVTVDTNPADMIDISVKCSLDNFKEINSKTKIDGLKIELIDDDVGKESLRMLVNPDPLKPTSGMVLSIAYITIDDYDKIIDFGNKLESRILGFLNSLGK